MTVDSDLRETDMAFLYETPEQGQAGQDGAVAVLDLPSRTVLSIGLRGDAGRAVLEDARAAILAAAKAEGWEADGPWRRLGYNSPMIPAARRFWELQLPVKRAVAPTATPTTSAGR
jgi:hypothetical protein